MDSKSLFRWGGYALVTSALLLASGGVSAAVIPGGGITNPLSPLLFYLGTISSVYAFGALYGVLQRNSGTQGFVGFLMATLGAILYSGPQLALLAGTTGVESWHDVWGFAMGNVLLVGPTIFFIGMILLGLVAARSEILPKWGGRLLTIGAATWLVAYFLSVIPGLLTVATLLTGTGMAWMGAAILSSQPERALP